MKTLLGLFLVVNLIGSAFACSADGSEGFLPSNHLNIPVGMKQIGGLNETTFNSVIDKFETVYAPVVAQMGGTLSIERRWTDGTVNAKAATGYRLFMYGGLARHSTITPDGFSLVLCHELGHNIGGYPKAEGGYLTNEGQADYFATLKCLRRLFLNDDNVSILSKQTAPKTLVDSCIKFYSDVKERAICIRSGLAGVSVANLFAAIGETATPRFDTPDKSAVRVTFDGHPAPQCRLDTYFQGAICEKSFSEDVSQREEVEGTCHASTGQKIGLRPLCWFRPKM